MNNTDNTNNTDRQFSVSFRGESLTYRDWVDLVDWVADVADLDPVEDEVEIERIAQDLDRRSTPNRPYRLGDPMPIDPAEFETLT